MLPGMQGLLSTLHYPNNHHALQVQRFHLSSHRGGTRLGGGGMSFVCGVQDIANAVEWLCVLGLSP